MKLVFNPWKILIWFVAVVGTGIFMIPTKEAIERFLFDQWGIQWDWMWVPLYLILWRAWYGVEWLWKTYGEMKHDV
jgi:hypothetical protein